MNLLDSCEELLINSWLNAIEQTSYAVLDHYIIRHLPFHLAHNRRFEKLRTLLSDYEWLQSKLDVTDPYTLITDIGYLPDDPDLLLVQSAIRTSAHILVNDKTQLASQLLGCLLNEKASLITNLLRKAERYGGSGSPWLRPLKRCLPLEMGSLIASTASKHIDGIRGFAFTPDGSKIISWDVDAICAWGSSQLEFLGGGRAPGRDTIRTIAPMPDNKRIAFSMGNANSVSYYDNDKKIFIWDIETKSNDVFLTSPAQVTSLATLGDLIIAAGGNMPPRIWTISSGRFLGFLPYETTISDIHVEAPERTNEYVLYEETEHKEKPHIHAITITPDGTAIVGLAWGWLCRWSLPERELVFSKSLPFFETHEVFITPDSNWCVLTKGKDIGIFDAYSGDLYHMLQGHTDDVSHVAVNNDRVYSTSRDHTIKIWDLHSRQCLQTFKNDGVRNIRLTPNGHFVLDRRDYIQLREIQSFQLFEQTEADLPGPINLVAMDATATSFLAAHKNHPVFWSNNTLITIPLEDAIRQAAISHDGQYLFIAVDNAIVIWGVLEKRIVGNLGNIGSKISFLKTADNGNILVGDENGEVGVWKLEKGFLSICLESSRIGSKVLSISPNGQYAISQNPKENSMLDVYDVKSGNKIRSIFSGKTLRRVNAVVISDDSSLVAVAAGSWRNEGSSIVFVERLIEFPTENQSEITKVIASLENHTDTVAGLAFSQNGKTLLICDVRGELLLWHINTDQFTHYYGSTGFRSCDISRDGNLILAGDNSGFVHLLSLEHHSLPNGPLEPAAFDFPLFSKNPLSSDFDKQNQIDIRTIQQKSNSENRELIHPKHIDSIDDAQHKTQSGDRQNTIDSSYHGIFLAKSESSFLYELEQTLRTPIPAYAKGDVTKFGFLVEDQHIVEIQCSEKHLRSLPESIGNLQALVNLNLESNRIEVIPESIGKIQTLINLNLKSNKITNIPGSICNLHSLTNLNLESNRITSIPKEIGDLKSLKTLTLLDNQLTSLPKSIGELDALEELNLGINLISYLPDEIGKLRNLLYLNISTNHLTSIPNPIGNLQALTKLYLHENRISSIPESLWALTSLKILRLDGNNISSIPEEVGQLSKLTSLNLLENKITSLSPKVHQILSSLEKDGCRVFLNPMPYKEYLNVFFPVAFDPKHPEIVWWFDLDGYLSQFNLLTSQGEKHIKILQPSLALSYIDYQEILQIMDSSGRLQAYSPKNRNIVFEFIYRIQPGQNLAAVNMNCVRQQIALIYTKSSHAPAILVLHDPFYSHREVAKRELNFGYFMNAPLEIDGDGNLITMEGKPPRDLVKLDRRSLQIMQRYSGSNNYIITAKLIGNLLFASNPKEVMIWNYSTSQLLFKIPFGLVYSIDWSKKYNLVFICSLYDVILLDLNDGKSFEFQKLPDLTSISVSEDGELLFLGREGYGDERKELENETPSEINRRLEEVVKFTHLSKEEFPLIEVRRLRKIQIWKIAELIQYFKNKSE